MKELFNKKEYQALANQTINVYESAFPENIADEMRTYLEQDVFIFSQLKTHTQLTQARALLKDEKGNLREWASFKDEILKINNTYNKHYLQAEYAFAVQSSISANQWASWSDDTKNFWLEYQTMGDELVRDSHQALNGIKLPKNDPFWEQFYPPNGWRCRCDVLETRAEEKPPISSKKAIAKGMNATNQTNSKGVNKLAMFRFNPGMQKKVFPPNNSYKPKHCGASKKPQALLPFASLEDERCKALQEIEEQARRNFETWEDVPTKKGQLKVSSKHGKNEKTENIEIASYFTNKYKHKIRLLGVSNEQKTADAFNETLGIKQEYKRPTKATKNAIDNAIKDGKKQANHIVLDIVLDFDDEILKRGIKGRVSQSKTVKTITVIRNGKDKTYTRDEILLADFEL